MARRTRTPMVESRVVAALAALAAVAALPLGPRSAGAAPTDAPERSVEPVVLTGAQLPQWSRLPAVGIANPYPSGAGDPHPFGDGVRDAHNGTLVVPPDTRSGVPVEQIAAYRWERGWKEIPVQVDERFPYFLANANSDFSFYSGTDEELTYEWDTESWLKTDGLCEAAYPEGVGPTKDPVSTLDDDDEVVFMASDAGTAAPDSAPAPRGASRQYIAVRLVDPLAPTTERYVYLFLKEGGSSFDADNGYVSYERDANADQWIDRNSFADDDPDKLGSSNTGYGPNLPGTVCDPDGTIRDSADRFPRDGVTVTTQTYRFYASGRWMIRQMRVVEPDGSGYGPDLIDRWKGRAFQQSPDSTISLVGFEDEQVNWEGNSVLLGERAGPVRAIREVWGADSGTNVTKTETFYRDSIVYRYRVRVHPIPPDGLYTSWDYNHAVAVRYYNEANPQGVPIDGINDELVGNIDELPNGQPAFFDAPDPTFTRPLAFFNWEQVSGRNDAGSLVYIFQINSPQSLENPTVVPYYRDDACLDDGTGDDPSPRQFPGDSLEESERYPCLTEAPPGYDGPFQQGAFGSHGVHYFFTNDTDNAFAPKPLTEIDGQQWVWAVPTARPTNVGDAYANTVKVPLVALTRTGESAAGATPSSSPSPSPTTVPGPDPIPGSPRPSPTGPGPTQGPSASPAQPPSPGPSPTLSPSASASPSPAASPPTSSPSPAVTPRVGSRQVSLEVERSRTAFGRRVELSGLVSGDAGCGGPVEVNIWRRVFGQPSFAEVARVQAGPDGSFSVALEARRSATYLARVEAGALCSQAASNPAEVLVRARIEINNTTRCNGGAEVEGRLRPSHPGTRVRLQDRVQGAWATVDSDRLDRRGRFELGSQACGRHRVVWPQQDSSNLRTARTLRL